MYEEVFLDSLKNGIKYLLENGNITLEKAYYANDPYSSNNAEDIIIKIDGEEVCRFEDILQHRHS